MVEAAWSCLDDELMERKIIHVAEEVIPGSKMEYYIKLWEATNMVDAVILSYLDAETVQQLPDAMLDGLIKMGDGMLEYFPFEVVTIHDEFKCHANNMNHLRQQYINILAELADSTLLDFILSSIHGVPGTYPKLTPDLSKLIRGSNYALS